MPTGLVMMNDAVIRKDLWVPITIRVAWDLHMAKIEVRSNVLDAARTHVLSHLESDVSVDVADRLAGIYTADFITRLQQKKYERPEWEPDVELAFSVEWRELLLAALSSDAIKVFWLYYSDGLPLEKVSKRMAKPVMSIEGLMVTIRETMRVVATQKGVTLRDWMDVRLDKAISYIALLATDIMLPPDEILSPKGKEYTKVCPRIRRAYYLLKNGVLSDRDIEMPEDNQFVPRSKALVLLLHPDMRKHTDLLHNAIKDIAQPVEQGAWLVDEGCLPILQEILVVLAEESTPAKQYLRGALVSGPGGWFDDMILGPLPIQCLEAARSRPWGMIDGIAELPLPLPPPPKSAKWWMVTFVSMLLSVSSLAWALDSKRPQTKYPIQAEFYNGDFFVDARFDVSEFSYLTVIKLHHGVLTVEKEWTPVSKGELATGDGRYYIRVDGAEIAVVSSAQPIDNIAALMQAAQIESNPLSALADHIHSNIPESDVVLSSSLVVP